jgi:hypothetical protein
VAAEQAETGPMTRLFESKRFNLFAFGLIAVLILIAYSNTFTSSFHFDDNPSIVENPSIKRVTSDNISAILTGIRPVVYLSLMLNYQLGGLNVVGYHIFNIAVHIGCSIFVFLLLLWTLNMPRLKTKYGGKARWMALFGALLFAVHPIQTEAVTYIITRTELLATFFYLATFLLFIKGASTNRSAYYIGAFFTAALSMASKEWAVTLPALLMLYDYLFIAEGKVSAVASRWIAYGAIACTWPIALHNLDLFSKGGAAGVGFNVTSTSGITMSTYWITSLNVIWTYVRLMLLPIHQNLDYEYRIAKTLLEFPTILSFLGHIAVIAGAFWLYRKKGQILVPFGLAWFYIGLSPVQSVVPVVDVIFEHRMYMPSVGFILFFVVAYGAVFDWFERRAKQPVKSGS